MHIRLAFWYNVEKISAGTQSLVHPVISTADTVMLVHTADTDKTGLSCLVSVGGVN